VQKVRGFTLIELVIVLAIAGILMGIAAVAMHPERTAVNQAATGLVNSVARARFEALKDNTNVGLRFSTAGAGGYELCRDSPPAPNSTPFDGQCASGQSIDTVTFGNGRVVLSKILSQNTTSTATATVMFDRRGVVFLGSAPDVPMTITLSDRSGSYTRDVTILTTGKAEVQ
jgi:type IV fimbrial biogenesis protein FimT